MRVFDAPEVLYWNSNPYAVQLSPDGRVLAVGSGGYYGHGGISLIDLQTGETRTRRFSQPDPDLKRRGRSRLNALTVSGVCFDDAGGFLAISTWSSGLGGGPCVLYRVHGLDLERVQIFERTPGGSLTDPAPTGIGLHGGRLYVRNHASALEQLITQHELPAEVSARGERAWRAHARLAFVEGRPVTGGGGSLKLATWTPAQGTHESFKAADGLVFGPDPVEVFAAPVARVTAVLAGPGGRLLTGGLDGEIHAWSQRDGIWSPTRTLADARPKPTRSDGAWATYRPASVVGLAALDDDRWFSVDADGALSAWRGERLEQTTQLPGTGTPRAIAAHPDTVLGPMVAVGVKATDPTTRGRVIAVEV